MADTIIRHFLEMVDPYNGGGGGGNGGSGGNGGGGGKSFKDIVAQEKDIKRELEKGNKGAKKGLGATLGIKFGIASLLKQSQVFTGFVGTIFQLMGALVDVILAPFLPILIPGIRLIADMVPIVAKYATAVYDFLDRTLFSWFGGLGWFDGVLEATKKALSAILVGIVMLKVTGLYNVAKSLFQNLLGKPVWRLAKLFFNLAVWDTVKLKLMMLEDIVKAGAKKALTAAWDNTGGKVITMLDTAWKGIVKAVWDDGLKAFMTGFRTRFGTFIDDGLSGLITRLRSLFETPISFLRGIADWVARPFKSLWGAIAGDVVTTGDSMFARVLRVVRAWPVFKVLSNLPQHLSNLFTWMGKTILKMPVIGALMKWLNKELLGKLGALKGLAGRALGRATALADPGRALLAKAPGAGMIGNITSKLSPRNLKIVGQGFKAIPVLGAVAELGFGAWATYKDYKKYGAKAAMGRAALTLANTTTALFDPTGIASAGGSIASNIAMDQMYKRMLDPKDEWKSKSEVWVRVENEFGIETYQKVEKNRIDNQVNVGQGQRVDRTTTDGYGAIG